MKTSLFALIRSMLLAALFLGTFAVLFAQGNDNPTGVAGAFNGNSSTGCSYDPYTGNATRTIPRHRRERRSRRLPFALGAHHE